MLHVPLYTCSVEPDALALERRGLSSASYPPVHVLNPHHKADRLDHVWRGNPRRGPCGSTPGSQVLYPRTVYTDLISLRLLAAFGDDGRRVQASRWWGLEKVQRARTRTISDHPQALLRHAERLNGQALVRP